jgi:hypothetical protein
VHDRFATCLPSADLWPQNRIRIGMAYTRRPLSPLKQELIMKSNCICMRASLAHILACTATRVRVDGSHGTICPLAYETVCQLVRDAVHLRSEGRNSFVSVWKSAGRERPTTPEYDPVSQDVQAEAPGTRERVGLE